MTKMKHNKINSYNAALYAELREEDAKYGGKKIERPQTDMRDRRPLKNLKKAWMEHVDDFDEVDDFYEH